MRAERRWVLWREVMKPNAKKPTKIPYQTNGDEAKCNDPATWTTFEAVSGAYAGGGYDGIGFQLGAGWAGMDLDKCMNPATGEPLERAQAFIDRLSSYTEVTPSGKGIHVICWAASLPGRNTSKFNWRDDVVGGVEMYTDKRYFTVTGDVLPDTVYTVEERQDVFAAIHREVFGDDVVHVKAPMPSDVHLNGSNGVDRVERCRRYLEKCPDSISGDNGHGKCLRAAAECFRFGLSESEAMDVMRWWSTSKSDEPWTDREIEHKLKDARVKVESAGEFGIVTPVSRNYGLRVSNGKSHNANKPDADTVPEESRLRSVCMADVKPERVDWLWPGRFPLGKLSIIGGCPGDGKSMIACDIIARVTSGTAWPDELDTPITRGSVILMALEDGLADTVRPRLDAAHADVSRIHAIEGVAQADHTTTRTFDISRDLELLEAKIAELQDCKLIIIDPVSAYLGGALDTYRDNEVRAVLQPLSDLAARYHISLLTIMHLRKAGSERAIYRLLASVAFAASARAIWMVTPDKEDPERRLMLPVKMNVGKPAAGMAFNIITPGCIAWCDGAVDMSVDDAMAPSDPDEAGPKVHEAMDWLEQMLSGGPAKAKDVKAGARECCINERTLRRAAAKLHVDISNGGVFGGQWYWTLPSELATAEIDVAM